MKVRAILAAAVVGGVAAAAAMGCAGGAPEGQDPDEPVFGELRRDPALTIHRGASEVSGSLVDDGIDVRFSSTDHGDGTIDVRVELDGMVLTAHYDDAGELLDGVSAQDGSPTSITETDRAAISRLLAGLEAELYPPVDHVTSKEEYDAVRRLTPAEERLFRVVDVQWSQWPSAVPLRLEIRADAPRGWTSWRRYASTNTTVTGCHDCNVCSWSGDCCDTGKKLGEYFNGANYGNCGTSSTGSQFTKDCTNHDQCVRTAKHGGHALASAY
ncbi:MAG: hypothetical protein IT372_10880, partial [Polyangiaceae bacterium]|nr:hypothetical protein [Polyangiaceae bacterium]